MDTDRNQAKGLGILRGSISVLTHGGPFNVNVHQDTNPVLLKGMRLPAEAEYIFKNPINHERNYINNPVSVELFFGENRHEGDDISLGTYQIFDPVPTYIIGPNFFEIIITISMSEVLSLLLRDVATQKYYNIAFIDISGLEPPPLASRPDKPFTGFTKDDLQTIADDLMRVTPRQARFPRRGKDLSQELTVSFEEAFHGTSKNIETASTQPCPVCAGSGVKPGKALVHCLTCGGTGMTKEEQQTNNGPVYRFGTCPDCHGDGLINAFPCQKCNGNKWIRSTRSITLQIPACIDQGSEICLLHQGEPGQDSGPAGHLRISIQSTAHPVFSRRGSELSILMPVSAGFARQGGHIRIPGFEKGSSFLVNLPPGTTERNLIRVFEGDDYSITAFIETYRPGLLFMMPNLKERLRAIHARLDGMEIETTGEIAGEAECDTRETNSLEQETDMERSPEMASFYVRRGVLYIEKNDQFHAMSDFGKALELDPICAEAYDQRAAVYGIQKDFAKAIADMEKAIDLNPENALYYSHKGMIHEFQNDPDKACAAYNRALELNPDCLEAYERRGELFIEREDLPAAIADFSQVLDVNPDNDEIRGKRGLVYMSLKEYDKAISDLDFFVNRHPSNPNGYNNRAFIFLQKNELEKALRDYNHALELNPRLVPARTYRGKTLLLLSRFAQAIEDLNQALTLDPKHAYPFLLLGQAYRGLEDREQAIIAFQKYLNSSQSPELCQEARQHLAELGINAP